LSDAKKAIINREASWLDFNDRVLEEASAAEHPLMERLKFLAITASNLDEFFMVRVAGLREQVDAGYSGTDPSGLTAWDQLALVADKAHKQVARQYQCWLSLQKEMERENILLPTIDELTTAQLEYINTYFDDAVYPVLTPLAIDAGRPFPVVANRSLNIGVRMKRLQQAEGEMLFAVVQVPGILGRFVEVPRSQGYRCFVLMEQLMISRMAQLFPGFEVLALCPFRITRNSDLTIDEGVEDLLSEIAKSVKKRKWGDPVRLELQKGLGQEKSVDPEIKDFLVKILHVNKPDIYHIDGPLDLTALMKFSRLPGFDQLRDKHWNPQVPEDLLQEQDIFAAIRQRDRLIHLPYESFVPVEHFLRRAAEDPDVLAIKQTLYRVSGNSPVVEALITAAENGKQVTVLVELKARFDEENNIGWARKLETAGCHVIYGLPGLKIHCKVLLVVRREDGRIRRYVHMSTGNYNDSTARLYTDIGLFTSRESFGADASALFNFLTGYSAADAWRKLKVAPRGLRDFFYTMIAREVDNARMGRPARITVKVNSLIDEGIIKRLYEASNAGVKIDLIVRGMCSLMAGLPGKSENITVRSIVGRYLEHSRIFYFENGGIPEVYLSSADWMSRNLDRRVEIAFPVDQDNIKRRIINMLDVFLKDNAKARAMGPDGSYKHVVAAEGEDRLSAQEWFAAQALNATEAAENQSGDYSNRD
jgi:polyphosphate kinase